MGNDGGVARHHQHSHRLAHRTADAQHHSGGDARNGVRNHHLIYSLPLRRSQRQTGFAHGTRAISHRIFRHRNDGGQRHNGKHNAARQPALAHRQVEHLLQKRHNDNQAEKAVNHRRYATQQLNDGFQQIPYPGIGYLRHIDCHRQTKRQCKKDGKQTDPQRPRNERQKAELCSRCCRGKPFGTGKDVLHRNGVVFQQMHRVWTDDELLRYKGYNARRTLHQLRNAGTCIFVGSAQLFFRIILCDVLQTEKADRKVLPSHFVPVCQLFIKDILYLCRSQFAHPVLLIQGQYIPFFYHFAAEQAQRFGKEEHDDKYNGKTRHKAATSQYTFYNLLKNLFHVAY